MNFLPHLLLLTFLGVLSLIVLFFYRWLLRKNTSVQMRILVLKTEIGLILSAPFLFVFLIMNQWKSVEVQVLSLNSLNLGGPVAGPVIMSQEGTHWTVYFAGVYLAGFFYMLVKMALSYRSAKQLVAGARAVKILGTSSYLSDKIVSPFSFGFPVAKIYLPSSFVKDLSPRDLEMALAHESIHLKNLDPLWKLLSLFARAFLFIFPWSYSLHRALELDMEIRCDEETQKEVKATPQEYGHLLLTMTLRLPVNQLLTNMTDTTIKRRILAMKLRTIHRPILSYIGSGLMIFAAILGIAVTSGATEKKTIFRLQASIILDGEVIARPMITVTEGEEGIISLGDDVRKDFLTLRLKMHNAIMPTAREAIGIAMDLNLKKDGKNIHSTPQMIVQESELASIEVGDDSGSTYSIEVLADRLAN